MNCSWLIIILLLLNNCGSNCSGNCSGSCNGSRNQSRNQNRTGGCTGASVRNSFDAAKTECDLNSCGEENVSEGFSNARYPMYGINESDCGCRTQS